MTPGALRHALALLLCACHVGCDNGSPAESQYDSDWRLVEDLVLTGTADSVFFSISGIAVDSAHKVYVLDGFGRRVHVFDADGSHLWSIGRRGEGPGEFVLPQTIAIGPENTVWIGDAMLRRTSVFNGADGEFLETHSAPWMGRSLQGLPFGPDGRYTGWIVRFPLEDSHGSLEISEYYPVNIDFGSGRADTFPPFVQDGGLKRFGEALSPYAPRSYLHLDGMGDFWFSDKHEYRLHRRTLSGDTTLSVGLDEAPVPVDDEDFTALRQSMKNASPQEVEKWIAALAKTQTKPMFYGFLSDGHGHTYVFPRTVSAPAGTAVDVFRHTGQYLGRMAFPERVDFGPGSFVGFATREHIYVAAELRLQPAVLRFRIER